MTNSTNAGDIYFAGGCFWGVEEYFSRLPGVKDVTVGYANGNTRNPSYAEVCSGSTGHAETVHVRYDPKIISLHALAEQFFTIIDPTSVNRQGNDVGSQYRSGIYYTQEEDKANLAPVMTAVAKRYPKPLAVELLPLKNYFLAEDYHQDHLKKHPGDYCHIDFRCLANLGHVRQSTLIDPAQYTKPSAEILQKKLSTEEYAVTQQAATERPFTGALWEYQEPGIYVDIVTGEPLFSSADKFDSGCGWPSFSKPIEPAVLSEHQDNSRGMQRMEVKSRVGKSHLGHVFPDDPRNRGGLRYCINSAALRFVPYAEMERQGYGHLKVLVQKTE